jgi:hypothetical protein
MEFTTHLELHSQTTRLFKGTLHKAGSLTMYGILTLYDVLFQGTYARADLKVTFFKLQLGHPKDARFQIWAFAASLAVTKAIPVGFFSSAYWYA